VVQAYFDTTIIVLLLIKALGCSLSCSSIRKRVTIRRNTIQYNGRILCQFMYFASQVMLLQIKCFHEIITIGYVVYKSYDLPWFRTLSWYFLFSSNYFFYGESLIDHFGVLLHRAVSIGRCCLLTHYDTCRIGCCVLLNILG